MPTLAFEMQCSDRAKEYSLECPEETTQWSDQQLPNNCNVRGPLALTTNYDPTRTMSMQAKIQNSTSLNESMWDLPAAANRSVDVAFLNIEWVMAHGLAKTNSSEIPRYVNRTSRIEARQCIVYNVLAKIVPAVTSKGYSERLVETTMIAAWSGGTLSYSAERPKRPRQPIYVSVDGYIDFLAALAEPLGDGRVLQRNATQYGPAVFRLLEASSQATDRTWPPPQQPARKKNLPAPKHQPLRGWCWPAQRRRLAQRKIYRRRVGDRE